MSTKQRSGFKVATITNDNQNNTFDRDNVYNAEFKNETGFEVTINSPEVGLFKIGAGKDIYLRGHPEFPTKLTFTVKFNPGHAATDSIKLIYTQAYVSCK